MLDPGRIACICLLAALACLAPAPGPAAAVILPPGFQQNTQIRNLVSPTDVEVAANGRVFVAEKSGIVKTYTSISDSSATTVADLRTQVHNYSNRGLLGLAIDPAYPAQPYIYAYYTLDAPAGGTPPVFGAPGQDEDLCPGSLDEVNCVVSARVSRLRVNGEVMDGPEQVLVNDWCQQFQYHAGGGIDFGADGYLYVSGGDGGRWGTWDYGQLGNPTNPCGDPPSPVGGPMTPPTAEGGRLRAQDLRTNGDPLGLAGSLIRIDPATGAGAPGNPRATSADANERRMLAHGFRNAARLAMRPGTNEAWIGDWGGGYWEEINRVQASGTAIRNYGWPCYEGGLDDAGVPYARIRPRSDDQELGICEGLYAEGAATDAPYWAYDHELLVTPGETCSIDEDAGEPGGKIWALGFYPAAGAFPPAYRGALLFGDELRECMWAMLPGGDGLPAGNRVVPFAQDSNSPLDIEATPSGELLWVDEDASNVKRIRWVGNTTNQPPTAAVTSDATSGNRPLTVRFDGAGSTDPDARDVLTYEWDLDGDGQLDDSTEAAPVHTFVAGGTFSVTLRVTDTSGASDTETRAITVRSGPVASISAPASSTTWRTGDTISFSGAATDEEDGTLAADRLDWAVVLPHCASPGDCHEHEVATFDGVAGGSFVAPDHAEPAPIEIRLTATDYGGETDTRTVTLQPRTAQLTVDSTPAGAQVGVDGALQAAPFTKVVVANSTSALSAPSPQTLGGTSHLFAAWSDGQGQTHPVKVPTAGATHQAVFASTALGTQTLTLAPEADARVERFNPDANFGSATALEADNSTGDVAESYLRFLVGGLSGSVTSARLRLSATSATADGPTVFGAPSDWAENGITWNSKPAPSTGPLSDSGAIASGDWVEWDVTEAVTSEGPQSFRLASAINDGVSFRSRESSVVTSRPQLVVTFSNVAYPRPKGATPLRVPLVPAHRECETANRVHGPPLERPACSPPVPSSAHLTVGTPDANGATAASTGHVLYQVTTGNPSTPEDEADVTVSVSVTDVRNRAGLGDYAGDLEAVASLRMTDRASGMLTVADLALPVRVPCAATAGTEGATCSVATTLDALSPGFVDEGARAVWQLGAVEVLDGGPDADAATPGNDVFLRQGIFIP